MLSSTLKGQDLCQPFTAHAANLTLNPDTLLRRREPDVRYFGVSAGRTP
jgi:hypothetical protein